MMATGFDREKMITYIVETEEYVFPLIEKLKDTEPQYSNALFLIKYQMLSVMETAKRLIAK
jgi:GTP pyrophosphokinase